MRVLFIGTGEIGLPALRALAASPALAVPGVVTQPDKPVGRQLKLTPTVVKAEAFALHLPVFQPEKIGSAASVAQLRYLNPDLIVVAAYGQILPRTVLELPRLGCLNLHTSLLPKYRGASPIHSAIAAGERQSGVTIMWMDEGLDTGDILLQEAVTLRRHETAQTLHDRLGLLGAELLLKAVDQIAAGKAPRAKQDAGKATLTRKLSKEQGHIDWNRTPREIDAHIRAMTPWPSAYASLPQADGAPKMLKIFTTILSRHARGRPGEVLRVDRHGILVAAKTGGLLLREVQLEGKRRMHAAEFARGFSLPVGLVLE